jgi:hypothetical protein
VSPLTLYDYSTRIWCLSASATQEKETRLILVGEDLSLQIYVKITAFLDVMSYALVHSNQKNSVVWVRERTIPTERPPLVSEFSAKFLRKEGAAPSAWRITTAVFSAIYTGESIYFRNICISNCLSHIPEDHTLQDIRGRSIAFNVICCCCRLSYE